MKKDLPDLYLGMNLFLFNQPEDLKKKKKRKKIHLTTEIHIFHDEKKNPNRLEIVLNQQL